MSFPAVLLTEMKVALLAFLPLLAYAQRHLIDRTEQDRAPNNCKEPPFAPKNGFITLSKTGTEAFFHCDDGFELSGKRSTYCRFGKWVPGVPNCTSPCFLPQAPFLGRVTLVGDGKQAEYGCEEGFRVSGKATTSCRNGEWDCCTPKCVPLIPCVNPRIPSNGFVLVSGEGSRAEYGCKSGYNLIGPQVRTCNIHGVFLGTRPACIKACRPLPDPRHGYALLKNSGLTTEYVCLPGYNLVGDARRICSIGRWSGKDAECVPKASISATVSLVPELTVEDSSETQHVNQSGTPQEFTVQR